MPNVFWSITREFCTNASSLQMLYSLLVWMAGSRENKCGVRLKGNSIMWLQKLEFIEILV